MKKLYLLPLILIACCYSFSAQGEKLSADNIANNPQEAFYYLKQLEEYYSLLWDGKDKDLKKYNIDESAKEQKSIIHHFKIDEIRTGGAQDERLKIAEKRGFFNLMEKVSNAPLKTTVDLENINYKITGTLLVSKYIYYLKILRLAQKNEWEKVAHNLTVWTNAISIIKTNGTLNKEIKRLIEHLLANYEIPDKEKKIILELKERLFVFSSDTPLTGKSNTVNNEVIKTKESSGKIILKDKITTVSLGGLNFYIKVLWCCNSDYSNPAFIKGSAAVDGTSSGTATSSFTLGGISFSSGAIITISNVFGTIAGTPKIITDKANHTKTITVDAYITYTITATGGGKTSSSGYNMVIPLSATIKE